MRPGQHLRQLHLQSNDTKNCIEAHTIATALVART